ncbi:secretion-regulating guanine nucleotide exchange factor-like [Musca vetustissima]|uniref:secretion-regulating guanine nucleotide exchange factor-like n=1 Tax=Musca vetustissima TaxID=27455 RepID=UPI002AB7B688|nr:secretion-regulating guanine nucleotide exchange factor-like [Musca vetustissima]
MSVYAWGANSHGQLGLGHESEMCTTPQLLRKYSFTPSSVRSIQGGGGHVLVLDACGQVHACGWNNRGQLGLDLMRDCVSEFKTIPGKFFDDVAVDVIACGWDISGCITMSRKLYVWGSNAFQQLGICQRGFTSIRKPFHMQLPRNDIPVRVTFGMRHTAVLTDDSKIYVYGRLRAADSCPEELNIIKISQSAMVVKLLPRLSSELRIQNISSGQNHLMMHLAPTEDQPENNAPSRRVLILGDNKFGQANAFQFDEEITQIATGWTHNAVMLKDLRIMMWGRNCYGQLGLGSYTENHPTPMELKLSHAILPKEIHLGSEHGLIMTKEGDVLTWGWNEHGNCGNDSTHNLSKPSMVDLPTSCKTVGTGAGFCMVICDRTN